MTERMKSQNFKNRFTVGVVQVKEEKQMQATEL